MADDPNRPITLAELEQSETQMMKMIAQQQEGLIMALLSVCAALRNNGAISEAALISQLHHTSQKMLENQKPALVQYPLDKLLTYLQQLARGVAPDDATH